MLDAGGYALHSKLHERIEEHEPQKLSIDALAVNRYGRRYLAAIEIRKYHTRNYFVIPFKPYGSEFVGFPFTAHPIRDELSDSRPIVGKVKDVHTPPFPGSYR